MDNRDNKVTKGEAERLALIIEEAAEIQQAATKILRHGWNSYDPTIPVKDRVSNRSALEKEIGHFDVAVLLAQDNGEIDRDNITKARIAKKHTIAQWLHHSRFKD